MVTGFIPAKKLKDIVIKFIRNIKTEKSVPLIITLKIQINGFLKKKIRVNVSKRQIIISLKCIISILFKRFT